jgi:hypothetical protein
MHQTEREKSETAVQAWHKRDSVDSRRIVPRRPRHLHCACCEGLVQHCPFEVFLANIEEYETHICNVVLPLSERQVCRAVPNIGCCPCNPSKSAATSIRFSRYSSRPSKKSCSSDSDAFPVHDPDILFDSEPFNSTGLVLWPDFWYASESPAYFAISSQKAVSERAPMHRVWRDRLLKVQARTVSLAGGLLQHLRSEPLLPSPVSGSARRRRQGKPTVGLLLLLLLSGSQSIT